MWPLILQCKLVGKAQEVCSSVPIEQEIVGEKKKTVLMDLENICAYFEVHFLAWFEVSFVRILLVMSHPPGGGKAEPENKSHYTVYNSCIR